MMISLYTTFGIETGLVEVPSSKAQQRATSKFNAIKYDSVLLRLPKGKLAIAQEFAKDSGLSFNAFVQQAIIKAMSNNIIVSPPVDTLQCLHCGAAVVGRKTKKFCSDKCRVNNHKKNKKISQAPIKI